MKYAVVVLPSAQRVLGKLPNRDARRIAEKIESLTVDPRPPGVKTIQHQKGILRLRVGDYRILYRVRDDLVEITVVRVAHRRIAYRNLQN